MFGDVSLNLLEIISGRCDILTVPDCGIDFEQLTYALTYQYVIHFLNILQLLLYLITMRGYDAVSSEGKTQARNAQPMLEKL